MTKFSFILQLRTIKAILIAFSSSVRYNLSSVESWKKKLCENISIIFFFNELKVFNSSCVTGASRGIGAKICTRLALHGFTVIGLARSDDKVQNLGNNLEVGTKGKIIGWKCDVESETEIQDAFKQVEIPFKYIKILLISFLSH